MTSDIFPNYIWILVKYYEIIVLEPNHGQMIVNICPPGDM